MNFYFSTDAMQKYVFYLPPFYLSSFIILKYALCVENNQTAKWGENINFKKCALIRAILILACLNALIELCVWVCVCGCVYLIASQITISIVALTSKLALTENSSFHVALFCIETIEGWNHYEVQATLFPCCLVIHQLISDMD